ncbi:hypothetical protein PSPO01_07686 [Paraphaeosphaeria sporulosa]
MQGKHPKLLPAPAAARRLTSRSPDWSDITTPLLAYSDTRPTRAGHDKSVPPCTGYPPIAQLLAVIPSCTEDPPPSRRMCRPACAVASPLRLPTLRAIPSSILAATGTTPSAVRAQRSVGCLRVLISSVQQRASSLVQPSGSTP